MSKTQKGHTVLFYEIYSRGQVLGKYGGCHVFETSRLAHFGGCDHYVCVHIRI